MSFDSSYSNILTLNGRNGVLSFGMRRGAEANFQRSAPAKLSIGNTHYLRVKAVAYSAIGRRPPQMSERNESLLRAIG